MRSGEVLCLNGQINLIGKSPGQRVSWQQRHGKYEMYIWLPKPGADWQSLSAIADDISHRVHRPYQLALGFWQRSLQQHMAQSRDVKRMAKLLKADLKAPDVCVFDRLTHSVTYQDSHEPRTYPLNEITDIQIRLEKPLVPQTDSDFDQFFDITYQIQLVLRDGRQFPVQQYFHREYKWEPGTDKLPTARVWAEEVAQCIRQFISKD